jgi:MATE family multidrug resistance protein
MDGAQVIAAGALRGLKDTALPLFAGILGYWVVGLGSGYWLAFRLGYGARGLWWGLAMGLAVAAALLTSRFIVLSRRGRAGGSSP